MRHRRSWFRVGPWILLAGLSGALAGEVPTAPGDVVPLDVGQRVPSVLVRTTEGEPVDLAEAVTRQPTVLVFYRGGW